MKTYKVSPWDVLYKLPRNLLETIARDIGVKNPHLSSKPDLIERMVAACDFELKPVRKDKT